MHDAVRRCPAKKHLFRVLLDSVAANALATRRFLLLLVLLDRRLVLLASLGRQAAVAVLILVLSLLDAEILVALRTRWHLTLRRLLARGRVVDRAH